MSEQPEQTEDVEFTMHPPMIATSWDLVHAARLYDELDALDRDDVIDRHDYPALYAVYGQLAELRAIFPPPTS